MAEDGSGQLRDEAASGGTQCQGAGAKVKVLPGLGWLHSGWMKRDMRMAWPLLCPICASLHCLCWQQDPTSISTSPLWPSSRTPPCPGCSHTFLPTLLLLTLHCLWMFLSCPMWGWHCSCLKKRSGRERKGFNSSFILGFCLNFYFIDKPCPKGEPWPRSYWHSQVRCRDWGQLRRKRDPPKPYNVTGDTLPVLGQAFPPALPLVDTCQSPLTAARGSAQSVGDAHPEGQLLCPMQGTRPLPSHQCSRHCMQWCSVPRLGHAATSHSGHTLKQGRAWGSLQLEPRGPQC